MDKFKMFINRADGSGIEPREMDMDAFLAFAREQVIKTARNLLYQGKSNKEIEWELEVQPEGVEEFWANVGTPEEIKRIRLAGEGERN